jgi:Tol biopolymer transport system component
MNSPTLSVRATQMGMILGTAAYMSPEQARGKAVTKATDIWAFGCVLYEMLCGRAAFQGEDVTEILAAVVKTEPDWAALPANTPAPIRRLLRRALAKDRRERLPDIADARLEIDDARTPPAADAGATADHDDPRAGWRRAWPWIVTTLLAMLLVAVTGLSVLSHRQAPGIEGPIQLMVVPPENGLFVDDGTGGEMMQFALSPDGRLLAFIASAAADGRPRLWVRALADGVAQPLPDTDGAAQPFWSPDSRFIGFVVGGWVKKVGARGGPVQGVCRAPNFRGGTWSREDVILFSPGATSGLVRVPANGGTPQPVTTLNATRQELSHRWPQFLPDGRHFLYFVRSAQRAHAGAYLGSLDSSESIRVVDTDFRAAFVAGFLLFVRDQTLLAQPFDARTFRTTGNTIPVAGHVGSNTSTHEASVSASEHAVVFADSLRVPSTQLTWLDRRGGVLGTIGKPGALDSLALSQNDRWVAVSRTQGDGAAIWLVDATSGEESQFTFDSSRNSAPVWSADGGRLFFTSDRLGTSALYHKAVNGTSLEKPLLDSGAESGTGVPSNASMDGKYLIYRRASPTFGIWVLPLVGARTPSVFAESLAFQTQGQLSPDDHWMAYTTDQNGAAEVFVQPFPASGGKYRISPSGGTDPKWRPDGKELFYVAPDGKLMAVSVTADATTFVPGTPQTLFDLHGPTAFNRFTAKNYAPSRDGHRFLVNRIVGDLPRAPMTVMLNWTAALNR